MPPITGAISPKNFKIETSEDGAAWIDRSQYVQAIEISDRVRRADEDYQFDGGNDGPIVTTGPLEGREITVRYAYTEGAADLFDDVEARQLADGDFYVRWTPKGSGAGAFQFTSVAGKITAMSYPQGVAADAKAVPAYFRLKVGKVSKSTL